MRGLMTAVIGMGILIAVGATVLVVLLVQRMSSAAAPNASTVVTAPVSAQGETAAMLDEPIGTHIAGVSLAGERLAVQLAGGGPDRIVVVDTRTGRIAARATLAR